VEDYLKDLPYLVNRSVPLQEYETVPPQHEPGLDDELPIYELSPERIRRHTPEEMEELREKRERERAGRYRWVYGLLGLRVVAHKDGTLVVCPGPSVAESSLLGSRGRRGSRAPTTVPRRYCPAQATPTGKGKRVRVFQRTNHNHDNSRVAFRLWADIRDLELRFGGVKNRTERPELART